MSNLTFVEAADDTSNGSNDDLLKLPDVSPDFDFDETVAKIKKDKNDANSNAMHVYLRIRPMTLDEQLQENKGCMELDGESVLLTHAPPDSQTYKNSKRGQGRQVNRFGFSKIFHEDDSQEILFSSTLKDSVEKFIVGRNALLFTYGVTNSGKTYTIQGDSHNPGLLPRSINVIFNSLNKVIDKKPKVKPAMFSDVIYLSSNQQDNELKIRQNVFDLINYVNDFPDTQSIASTATTSSTGSLGSEIDIEKVQKMFAESHNNERCLDSDKIDTSKFSFSVWVSYAEIYNEYIYDLLTPIPLKKKRRSTLKLGQDTRKVPYIKGLTEIYICSVEEAAKVLSVGRNNLHIAATKLNQTSSRSHSIFTLKLVCVPKASVSDYKNALKKAVVSTLSFCDLAGAERYTKTNAVGLQVKEAGNINSSLLALGRCMKAIRKNQMTNNPRQKTIVPYRDSKLTRLFQSYLCGKASIAMIVNINQLASMFDETLHALKYSAIAQDIVIRESDITETPKRVNVADGDKTLEENEFSYQELVEMIEKLEKKVREEKLKNQRLEIEVRQEVAECFQNQIELINKEHEEELEILEARLENKFEEKMNNLAEMYQNTTKRQRVSASSNDNHTRESTFLETKFSHDIEDLKEKLERSKHKCDDALTALKETVSEKNQLQTELTSTRMQFSMELQEARKNSNLLKNENQELRYQLEKVQNEKQKAEMNFESIIGKLQNENSELKQEFEKVKQTMSTNDTTLSTTSLHRTRFFTDITIPDSSTPIKKLPISKLQNDQDKTKTPILSPKEINVTEFKRVEQSSNSEEKDVKMPLVVSSSNSDAIDSKPFQSFLPPVDEEDTNYNENFFNTDFSGLKTSNSKRKRVFPSLGIRGSPKSVFRSPFRTKKNNSPDSSQISSPKSGGSGGIVKRLRSKIKNF